MVSSYGSLKMLLLNTTSMNSTNCKEEQHYGSQMPSKHSPQKEWKALLASYLSYSTFAN